MFFSADHLQPSVESDSHTPLSLCDAHASGASSGPGSQPRLSTSQWQLGFARQSAESLILQSSAAAVPNRPALNAMPTPKTAIILLRIRPPSTYVVRIKGSAVATKSGHRWAIVRLEIAGSLGIECQSPFLRIYRASNSSFGIVYWSGRNFLLRAACFRGKRSCMCGWDAYSCL
jgi:hypothetical protein